MSASNNRGLVCSACLEVPLDRPVREQAIRGLGSVQELVGQPLTAIASADCACAERQSERRETFFFRRTLSTSLEKFLMSAGADGVGAFSTSDKQAEHGDDRQQQRDTRKTRPGVLD